MPHSTTNSSSPIPIPGSNNYARNSNPSSFSTPTATTRSTTSNGSDYVYNAQEVSNVGIGFGQSYVYSGVYSPAVPVGRNLQPYPRDYHCCGMDHQNLHDLIQHVDNYHRGMIVHDLYDVNGIIQIPYEANTLYSQYHRWNSTSIPTPVSSIHPPLNGSVHEQKSSTQNNVHPTSSTSVYSVNVPSLSSYNKHKGSLEYNQSELGHLNGFDQMGGITAGQNQSDQELMLLFLCEQNPTDPNLSSSTLFEGQTQTPSSMSTSLEDDPLREFPSKKTLQSPSFSETPRVSSPISSDDNSTVVSPVATDRSITIPNLGQPTASSSSTADAKTSPKGSSSTPLGQDDNSVKRSPTIMLPNNNGQQRNSSQQPSYGTVNGTVNNSRQRSIASTNSGVTTQHRRSLSSYGSGSDLNKSLTSTNSNSNYYSDFLQSSVPRRSSTSNISNDQPQYGSTIHIPSLGQVNNRPVIQPRRSSTSNLSARPIPTTSQSYSHITIGSGYTQYPGSTVDNYPLVGYMPSGETGSGASQFVKYQRIQPKAGVAMSDVYTDPALGGSSIKGSKKRTTSVDNKSIKRRVTKSDEPATEAPTSDLADVNRGGEADIYPYKCSVLGCPKAYKNANGLKYHNEHGHAQTGTGSREKPWACRIGGCLKTYGSKGGLIYHVKHCHPNDLWALP